MKTLKYCFIITIILSVSVQTSYSQSDLEANPPTLKLGLDGLTFTKGSLDAKLIMEIIAEKQSEVKLKVIQNAFLKKVENGGGTIYSFVDNVIRGFVLESDTKNRTTKIIGNSVNLVFVISYLEYFLATCNADQENKIIDFYEAITGLNYDRNNKISLKSFSIEKRDSGDTSLNDVKGLTFISLLIDMSSEVIRADEKLKQLGIMKLSYSATYEYLNRYNRLIKEPVLNASNTVNKKHLLYKIKKEDLNKDSVNTIITKAETIFEVMQQKLAETTNYIGLIKYISEELTFKNEKLELITSNNTKKKELFFVDKLNEIESLNNDINVIITDLTSSSITDSIRIEHIKNLTKISLYLDKTIRFLNTPNTSPQIIADIIYTFHSEFIPILIDQSYTNVKYLEVLNQLNTITNSFGEDLLKTTNILENGIITELDPFLILVSKLYEFNKISTISEYINLIDNIGSVFPDDNLKNAISIITTFVKDYTVIDKNEDGNQELSFNVESFISRLGKVKPHKLNHFEFLFTVGMNNAFFVKNITLEDGGSVSNLSFVSEKIGLKFKIIDQSFWKDRNPGETYQIWGTTYTKLTPPSEPLISNFHGIVYASGLLYNLVNIKSEKEFEMPLIGTGLGLTFYNALDFNISVGVPVYANKNLKESFKIPFVNFGFDIQFLEYYDRLQKKNKSAKTQKKLAKAKL